jgi:hypothetical protein
MDLCTRGAVGGASQLSIDRVRVDFMHMLKLAALALRAMYFCGHGFGVRLGRRDGQPRTGISITS